MHRRGEFLLSSSLSPGLLSKRKEGFGTLARQVLLNEVKDLARMVGCSSTLAGEPSGEKHSGMRDRVVRQDISTYKLQANRQVVHSFERMIVSRSQSRRYSMARTRGEPSSMFAND